MNSLASIFLLVAALGQIPPDDPYQDWSDTKVESELESLTKKRSQLYNDKDAPEAWKKMKSASDALDATSRKWIDEQTVKSGQLDRWRADPEVKKRLAVQEQYEKEIRSLQREQYARNRKNGHAQALSRHAALSKVASGPTSKLHELKFDVLNFPRIDGSTSTQPLAVLIACKYFQTPSKWVWKDEDFHKFDPEEEFSTSLRLDFGYRPEPEFQLFEYALRADAMNPVQERLAAIINSLLVVNASTHQSYLNLIEGKSDLGLIARRPSASELEAAKAKGVELDVQPVALDALVFLVNKKQSVVKLSTAQIRDIYQGKVKNWKELGGSDAEINAYQRTENSGSQELMRELVMKGDALEEPKLNLVGRLMSYVYLNLTQDEEGIAYSVHYYEQYMIGSAATKTIAVDGVEPSFESIQSRTYPHFSEVFVAIRKNEPEGSSSRRLRDWMLSEEGQGVVRESGYVPILRTSR